MKGRKAGMQTREAERAASLTSARVTVDGKHLSLEGEPFRARGTTYGSFVPRSDGELFPEQWRIKADLGEMAERGLNVIRTYTLPPREFLDLAAELEMRVVVGLDFRDWRYEQVPGRAAHRRVLDAGRRAVEEAMERCAHRPEVLAVAVGNEVPVDVVRVHGISQVEDVLSELVDQVHAADPEMLATYCNFPTTEFLRVSGQDLACFNVFLEDAGAFRRYMRHLQATAHGIPLLITELGLASNIHGEEAQAHALEQQLRIVDECGIAGATIFSWTDEWGIDGHVVEGWSFGITDHNRKPKPALDVAERWARSSIQDLRSEWPSVSVVVCAYNCENLIEKCLRSLEAVDYPSLEVIVCDDGSTDRTVDIARSFPFRVLSLDHAGLSNARNAGIAAASGEIVAFLDSDAFCHPDWPYHLALSLEDFNVVATGGPNLPVPDASTLETAIAQSPGAPTEVLIADDRAEHVPGCNMAYRKWALEAIGGFNALFTAAGDDVDVCWNILDMGWEIGFAPAAQVHHHRRDTVRGYLKQQRGYGRAESLLTPFHRHRFNNLGQAKWAGFVYGGPRFLPRLLRPLVYHGYIGSAPYQPVAKPTSELVREWGVALTPAAVLIALCGLLLSVLSPWGLALTAATMAAVAGFAVGVALGAVPPNPIRHKIKFRILVAFLHLLQPTVRAWARLRTRVPRRPPQGFIWTGDRIRWIKNMTRVLGAANCATQLGGPHSSWDIETWKVGLVSWRITTAVLWSWTPVVRRDLRLKRPGLIAFVAAAALWLLSPLARVALGLVLSVIVLEAWWLRRRVDMAITVTTQVDLPQKEPAGAIARHRPPVQEEGPRIASDPHFPPSWLRQRRGTELPLRSDLEEWERVGGARSDTVKETADALPEP